MATPPAPTPTSKPATTKQAALRRIDEVAAAVMGVFSNPNSMEEQLQVATAMKEIKAALTPEIMSEVMELMNKPAGFMTDRDPNQNDWRTGKPHIPYSLDVVKDVFIEACLRGLNVIGNEINIISGRLYITKAGLHRKVTTWPARRGEPVEVTNFRA